MIKLFEGGKIVKFTSAQGSGAGRLFIGLIRAPKRKCLEPRLGIVGDNGVAFSVPLPNHAIVTAYRAMRKLEEANKKLTPEILAEQLEKSARAKEKLSLQPNEIRDCIRIMRVHHIYPNVDEVLHEMNAGNLAFSPELTDMLYAILVSQANGGLLCEEMVQNGNRISRIVESIFHPKHDHDNGRKGPKTLI